MSISTFKLGFQGEYNLVVRRPDGSTYETGWFKNIITDIGLDRLATSGALLAARVGTGTSVPVAGNTDLDNQIASTTSETYQGASNSGAPLYKTTVTYSYAFAQGAVVGNITELGIGWAATGATLFSRALILDTGGSPISLTITAIDQLTVYYRLIVTPPLSDMVGTVNISGTDYGYTARIGAVSSFFAQDVFTGTDRIPLTNTNANTHIAYAAGCSLGSITSTGLSGTSSSFNPSSVSYGSYTPGSYFANTTINMSISLANLSGGVQGYYLPLSNTAFRIQYRFDTPIPKDNTKTMSLTFRSSWARV